MTDMVFNEWRQRPLHKSQEFVEDGIVDPDSWNDADPKILFLAKEAYGGPFDLREEIRESAPYKNWYTVADWTFAITNALKHGTIPDFRPSGILDNWERVNTWLRRIAFVNIKKSNGTSVSTTGNLAKYVESDKDLLHDQINTINPDIVLCCYTFELGFYQAIHDVQESELVCVSEWCYHHEINGKTRLVIDYWHFANQYPNKITYYALCAVLQKYKTTQLSNYCGGA